MSVAPRSQIAVVDGQLGERKEIAGCLEGANFEVHEFGTAGALRQSLRDAVPDLVLAELRLPDTSGFSLCRLLREDERTRRLPVLMVSRWSSEMDRIVAFECGADDFVPRPFSESELRCRVEALLRHPNELDEEGPDAATPGDEGRGGGPEPFDPRLGTKTLSDLTLKEASILTSLIRADGRPLSRDELIQLAWGPEARPSVRCIDAHVKSLRRKLVESEGRVETVRGFGYRYTRGEIQR